MEKCALRMTELVMHSFIKNDKLKSDLKLIEVYHLWYEIS